MDIIGGITAATEGLKLVNELRKIDKEWDKAELKIRLIEVVDKLVDAKQALVDAQEREANLQSKVKALKESASRRASLKDRNGLLYEVDQNGAEIGEPYCNLCFVREDKPFRLRHFDAQQGSHEHYRCDNCKTVIKVGPALPVTKKNINPEGWLR